MLSQKSLFALIGVLVIGAALCTAQDYDDDGYGNQGQNDGDSYSGNDADGYNANAPNQYQLNVNSDGSNNSPQSYNSPQNAAGDADGDYEGDDNSAAASSVLPSVVRVRRSTDSDAPKAAASAPKLRVKRHGKYYIGPVYTYVKTDKHANFKWGVKHKVGKKHHG